MALNECILIKHNAKEHILLSLKLAHCEYYIWIFNLHNMSCARLNDFHINWMRSNMYMLNMPVPHTNEQYCNINYLANFLVYRLTYACTNTNAHILGRMMFSVRPVLATVQICAKCCVTHWLCGDLGGAMDTHSTWHPSSWAASHWHAYTITIARTQPDTQI